MRRSFDDMLDPDLSEPNDDQRPPKVRLMPISGSAGRDRSLEREEALLSQIHALKQHVLQLQEENEAQANELAECMNSDNENTRLAQEEIRRLYKSSVFKDKEIAGLTLMIEQLRLLDREAKEKSGGEQVGRQKIAEYEAMLSNLQARVAASEALCSRYESAEETLGHALEALKSDCDKAKLSYAHRYEEMSKALEAAELGAKSQEDTIVELTRQLCLLKKSALAPPRELTTSKLTQTSPQLPPADTLIITDEERIEKLTVPELDTQLVLIQRIWGEELWTATLQAPAKSRMKREAKARFVKFVTRRHVQLKASLAAAEAD